MSEPTTMADVVGCEIQTDHVTPFATFFALDLWHPDSGQTEMIRRSTFSVIVALLLLAAALIYIVFKWERFWAIDGCLDQGFRWDYVANQCDETFNSGDLSPYDQCRYYGGEWDFDAGTCVGGDGDPWPPPGGFEPQEE